MNDNTPIEFHKLRKSNELISARYNSSLLENQLAAIGLSRIQIEDDGKDSKLIARLFPGELKRLISDENHIYRDLKNASKTLVGHSMVIEDGNGNFSVFAAITNASFVDGVFTLQFNDSLKQHVLGLEKSYTTLELSVLTDFKFLASFRLFELLKKDIYKSNPKVNDGLVMVEYNLAELRFMLGYADNEDKSVREALSKKGKIDWDEVYEKLPNNDRKKYQKWADFSKYVLKKAQAELLEKSPIRFEYEGKRRGRFVTSVLFYVYPNTPKNPASIEKKKKILDSEFKQLEIPANIPAYSWLYEAYEGHNELIKEDIDFLLAKANYDPKRVADAIDLADRQNHIENYMGWIISCINNYDKYVPTEVLKGSHEDALIINEVINDYKEQKANGSVQAKVWERFKQKEEFPRFKKFVLENGLTIEQLELAYSLDEVTAMFSDWLLGREVTF